MQFKDCKFPAHRLLNWVGLSKSSWYYKPTNGKRGRKPSTHTLKKDGTVVANEQVVKEIKNILTGDLEFYGYEKTSWELKDLGFIINHKKVYRLMGEEGLLLFREKIKTSGKRDFVKFRKIDADHPLQYLVMDIKYIYVHNEKRFYYLLTIMDVCTRIILGHLFKSSIRKQDVVLLLGSILQGCRTKGIVIRNDNGSQFLAHQVREYINKLQMNHEFTHIATPQENSYIESFFSVLERELIRRNWFDSYYHAKMKIADYIMVYNYRRKHRSLKRMSPYQYLNRFFPEFSDKHPFKFSTDLSRVSLVKRWLCADTRLALDKSGENLTFVQSENSGIALLNQKL